MAVEIDDQRLWAVAGKPDAEVGAGDGFSDAALLVHAGVHATARGIYPAPFPSSLRPACGSDCEDAAAVLHDGAVAQ
ncbi:MAG: hypothetical protein LBR74_00065 [Eubacterium sp.]|nr:hypothetical protein [Eubacterium sp.]